MTSSFEVIEFNDNRYPAKLKNLKVPPKRLYYKGVFSQATLSRSIAVVGSRRCTTYSDIVIRKLLPDLILNNITIVSGFMFGVDSKAHSFCIENSGITVGVLPYGINFKPPRYMQFLYESILSKGGALISEYPNEQPPEKWTFIARNRLVAGISLGVLVIEAGDNSGSLHTAKYALEVGSKLFSVPGSILSPTSVGTNNLIKNSAVLVSSSLDILRNLSLIPLMKPIKPDRVNSGLDNLEMHTFNLIHRHPGSSFDFIQTNLSLDAPKLSSTLASLLLKSCIQDLNGRYYAADN